MPTPENRSKLLPARGTKAALEASLADLLDGEMTYATDEMVYYMVQDGALVAVNAATTTTTAMVETTEEVARRAGRTATPPDLPPGYTDLKNQREVNWWQHRETENVANRTTKLEQHQVQQDERIYALENAVPDVDGGGFDKDLEAYAKKEYVDLQDGALDERLKDVEVDYTTTYELNAVNSRVTKNSKEITALQEGFDAALLAAQEGADNLQIELQSYASKEELGFVDAQYKLADEKILEASQEADTTLRGMIDANTKAIEEIEIPDVPDVDLTEVVSSTARISEKETMVWAGQKQMAPVPDPSGSIGWSYTSAGDGTKANWTLWSQDRDSFTKLTLADVFSYSLVMTGKGTPPYLQVYTKRKNDGFDAASTYRSRINYQLDGEFPAGLVSLALLTSAPNTPLYANLARLVLNRTQPRALKEGEDGDMVGPMFSVGPGEEDEEISKVVVGTNSAAAEGETSFMLSSLMLHTKQGTYDVQLEFTGLTEAPEAPDVNLDGYATEEFVESALENYASTGELGAAEVRIGTNESDIKDLQDAVESIVIPELPEIPEVNLDAYATVQYVDGACTVLSERIKKLEDAPPPQVSIDWDNLPPLP